MRQFKGCEKIGFSCLFLCCEFGQNDLGKTKRNASKSN